MNILTINHQIQRLKQMSYEDRLDENRIPYNVSFLQSFVVAFLFLMLGVLFFIVTYNLSSNIWLSSGTLLLLATIGFITAKVFYRYESSKIKTYNNLIEEADEALNGGSIERYHAWHTSDYYDGLTKLQQKYGESYDVVVIDMRNLLDRQIIKFYDSNILRIFGLNFDCKQVNRSEIISFSTNKKRLNSKLAQFIPEIRHCSQKFTLTDKYIYYKTKKTDETCNEYYLLLITFKNSNFVIVIDFFNSRDDAYSISYDVNRLIFSKKPYNIKSKGTSDKEEQSSPSNNKMQKENASPTNTASSSLDEIFIKGFDPQ